MTWLFDFWRSLIGGKVTMAITGLLLFGFVVAHLIGNLQLFGKPELINDYAKFLAGKPVLLWIARSGLFVVFVLHIAIGVRLARQNRAARPVAYEREATIVATYASRSMLLTGLSLLVFTVYHVLHFTLGVTNPADFARKAAGADGHDVHAMVTASFGNPAIVAAYVAFQLVLFFHLKHGIQSLAQTLGLDHGRVRPIVQKLSLLFAALVAGGNLLLALSVLTGFVKVAP